MKVVLDANVLVSAFTRPGTPALLIDRWTEQRFELTLSTHILDGVRRAWNRPYFRPLITYDEAQSHLDMLTREAEIVTPVDTVRGVAEDLEDDLRPGDRGEGPGGLPGHRRIRRLREVGEYAGVRIVTPRELLDRLDDPLASDPESLP